MSASFPLKAALTAWATPDFEATLKRELAQLDPAQLPLQQGLAYSSYATTGPRTFLVKRANETGNHIVVKVGVFFSGIIAGCSCADDPTPVDEQTEYCEMLLTIDKSTANTTMRLITD